MRRLTWWVQIATGLIVCSVVTGCGAAERAAPSDAGKVVAETGVTTPSRDAGNEEGAPPSADAAIGDSMGDTPPSDDAEMSDGAESQDAGVLPPTIAITSPVQYQQVQVTGPVPEVPVAFVVTHFAFYSQNDPACASTSDNCGHVDILLDGTTCRSNGTSYNGVDTTGSPATANISSCPGTMWASSHNVQLELHHNDDSPILDPATNLAIQSNVTFITHL